MNKRHLAIPIAIALISSVGDAQRLPCNDAENVRAEEGSDRLRSWDNLYRWYKLYGRCNNVSAAEGVSESIARILVDHWTTMKRLARLASMDAGFRRFVMDGVNATLDMSDIEQIRAKTMTCPKSLVRLCGDLRKQADAAIDEATHLPRGKAK
jgi:hypothetical protein